MRHDLEFSTPDAMAEGLATAVAGALVDCLALKGRASLILPGGSSPRRMFEELSRKPLAWNRVKISLADERLVPATDPQSNEKLVRDYLLRNEAQSAVFIPLWQGEGDPVESALEAVSALDSPFAMVVLGLGEDGHFASLFPDLSGLDQALDASSGSKAIFVPPAAGRQPRVSLTLATLLATRSLAISFVGEKKRRVLERALEPGSVRELPVRALVNQDRAPADIYWSH